MAHLLYQTKGDVLMNENTKIELVVTGGRGDMDSAVHSLWMHKEILAPVLKRVVPEYMDCSVEEVISMIDADIRSDITVSDIGNCKAESRGTEQYKLTEKLSRFDVRIKSKNPKLSTENVLVMLHIDYEVQNDYYPRVGRGKKSYAIERRGVYYAARMLDGQLSYATHQTDYNALEKCYSIWVCTRDVPKSLQNTVIMYSMKKQDLAGSTPDRPKDYDLMSVIVIRLGDDVPEDSVFEFIKGVNRGRIDVVEKYVDTKQHPEIKEEAVTMEGFADVFIDEGRKEGRKEGIKIGEKRAKDAAEAKISDARQRYIQECLDTGRATTVEEAEKLAEAIFR